MKKEFPRVGARSVELDNVKDYGGIRVHLDKAYCPHCGQGPLDGATGTSFRTGEEPVGNTLPETKDSLDEFDGMPTFCIYCSGINIYRREGNKLILDKPTDEEIAEWKANPDQWQVMTEVQSKIAEMGQQERLRGNMKFAKGNTKRF